MSAPVQTAPRLFQRREAQLAPLDDLPRGLWLGSAINALGSLQPRLYAVRAVRHALLAGDLSGRPWQRWPDHALADALDQRFRTLELPALCREREAITDLVVSSMLWHLDRIVDYMDQGSGEPEARQRALQAFADDWRERSACLEELESVLGDVDGLLKNMHWDELRGVLRSEGWPEVVRARRLMEHIPELARVIRRLGRAAPSESTDEPAPVDLQVMEQTRAPAAGLRVTRVPDLPGETRSIHRSGRIARMLPAETMLLSHPRLRLVWHARHAERCLLTYEEDDRMRELVQEPQPAWRPSPQRRLARRLESGPMLVCVDTSGSMQGGAEAVAKAVVLEAARTAHAQQRPCRLYAFGGPEEIVELELRLDGPGIRQLTDFMSQGFRGGTDVCGPLERVIERIGQERWKLADLLLASDGEFGATPATAGALARAKADLGLRVQGVLVGDRETIGMLELADDIYWVRDWRRYGTSESDSPLHSRSLTALYFPNALRSAKSTPD